MSESVDFSLNLLQNITLKQNGVEREGAAVEYFHHSAINLQLYKIRYNECSATKKFWIPFHTIHLHFVGCNTEHNNYANGADRLIL